MVSTTTHGRQPLLFKCTVCDGLGVVPAFEAAGWTCIYGCLSQVRKSGNAGLA